jgi:Family of unknown function (DUF6521)
MPSSTARSPVAAAMLNPALLAALSASAVERYQAESGQPMPWAFPFLIAPLVLHRDTREALPQRITTHWARWVSNHSVLQAGFAPRALSLVEPVRDGLRFGLSIGALRLADGGRLTGGLASNARVDEVGDVVALIRAAGFVGRWLTRLDQPATAFALLGVTP